MPLKPYMVAMLFGAPPNQKICLNAATAPSEAAAVGVAVAQAIQQLQIADKLQGINVQELQPEFLRNALRAHEGTLGKPGEVAHLRPVETVVRAPNIPEFRELTPEELAVFNPPDGAA